MSDHEIEIQSTILVKLDNKRFLNWAVVNIFCKSMYSISIEEMFSGNFDRNTVVTNVLNPPILNVMKARIHPNTWRHTICLRFEILGCQTTPYRKDQGGMICIYKI